MTTPFFELKEIENPYRIRCGERRIFKVDVEPFVAGDAKLTLSLTASTCFFGGGKKELVTKFVAANEDDTYPLEVQLVMMGSHPTTYTLNLKIEAENSEGGKYDEIIEVKLNCTNPMTEAEQTVKFSEEPLTTLVTPVPEEDTEKDTDIEKDTDAPVVKTDTESPTDTDTGSEGTEENT